MLKTQAMIIDKQNLICIVLNHQLPNRQLPTIMETRQVRRWVMTQSALKKTRSFRRRTKINMKIAEKYNVREFPQSQSSFFKIIIGIFSHYYCKIIFFTSVSIFSSNFSFYISTTKKNCLYRAFHLWLTCFSNGMFLKLCNVLSIGFMKKLCERVQNSAEKYKPLMHNKTGSQTI